MIQTRFLAAAGLAIGVLAAAVAPASAEKLSLGAISDYLNDLQTVRGEFTQINDDGTISTGEVYIRRPGRVRFEYDPPDQTLVVADGNRVGVIDGKSNEGPQAYPLHRTPLSIILARDVDLTRERMVIGHESDGKTTTVTAQDPENPDYGSIELVFTGPPVELRQWVINDSSGMRTTVILGDMERGVRIASDKFEIPGVGPTERQDR
ncbi:LolA family protein [Roseovarius salinarum]|uniref:LolA family protein n=1 Tax=Roseovarius salinarum TaxID=1981892 RepID=UPI000C32E266|nr:outer membrane lipoprotein carrier protein LolA [Roseovarius salinarum]